VLLAAGFGLTRLLAAQRVAHHEAAALVEPEHDHGEPEHGLGGTRRDLVVALSDEHDNVRARAVSELGALGVRGDESVLAELIRALDDPSDAVKENAARALGVLGRPEAAPALEAALLRPDQDEWVNLREAEALVRCGGRMGLGVLIGAARGAEAQMVRGQALALALAFVGEPPLPPRAAGEGSTSKTEQAALARLEAWWQANATTARWDPGLGRFAAD
jgi:HEAT repeat protein